MHVEKGHHPVPNCIPLSVKWHSITALFLCLHTTVDESASVLQLCVRLLTLQLQSSSLYCSFQAPHWSAWHRGRSRCSPLLPCVLSGSSGIKKLCVLVLSLTHTYSEWICGRKKLWVLCTHYPYQKTTEQCGTGNINKHGIENILSKNNCK